MAAAKGNRYAAKDNRAWGEMMRRKVHQNPDKLEAAVMKVIDCAADGEPWAVTELRNTLDGKPVQQIEHSGDMSFTKTVRDLTDDELARVVLEARAGKEPDTDGQTLQ